MTALTALPRDRRVQRASALSKANAIRVGRADLKYRIARGETTVVEVLADMPPEAASWRIGEMLTAQPRWGTTRARKFCVRNQIGEMRPVGALTERQRRLVIEGLSGVRDGA